jgi:hypothetical protein
VDDRRPFLFHQDPYGRARAIGGGSEGAEALLRDSYRDGLQLVEAEDLALSTLRQVIQEKLSENNIEVACARVANGKFEIYTPEERQVIVETAAAASRICLNRWEDVHKKFWELCECVQICLESGQVFRRFQLLREILK